MQYLTCRYNLGKKDNRISSKIYKAQKKVQQKVQQIRQHKVHSNYVSLLIKRIVSIKLVESICILNTQ